MHKTSRTAHKHRKPPSATARAAHSNVGRWVLGAYVAVLMYASLHPLELLRWTEANPLAFLNPSRWQWVGWRPYGVGALDAWSNWAAYMPLGFGVMLALRRWQGLRTGALVLISTLAGTVLSVCLEALQTYHPMRVPSIWDVCLNAAGASTGAALCRLGRAALSRVPQQFSHRVPRGWFAPHAGAVWAVLGLWSLAQLHPQSWVFVTAPLRTLWAWNEQGAALFPLLTLPLVSMTVVDTAALARLETLAGGLAMMSALGLLRVGSQLANHAYALRFVWMGLAWALMLGWQWAIYAAQFGTAGSLGVWGAGVWTACWIAGGFALLLGAVSTLAAAVFTVAALGAYALVVQMLPAHPYASTAAFWQYGRFTHLYGLTAMVSALWPGLALAALVLQLRYAWRR